MPVFKFQIIVKRVYCPIFQIYTWLVIYPVSWTITILIALLTILFSILVTPRWSSKWVAPFWGKLIIWVTLSRVELSGLQHIDKKQSYIIVCNHQSIYDMLTIYGYLPLEFKWVMKKELLKMPFVGMACKALGHVFVDRGNSEQSSQTLKDASDKISDGVSAFFFPEGTRSRSGELKVFKKGAYRMAKELKLPILPMTITDANKVMPANSLIICPYKIKLSIHPAIKSDEVEKLSINQLIDISKSKIASRL
jgi:1-acyl-sn-glycerol-3-phosphate acyltransferase